MLPGLLPARGVLRAAGVQDGEGGMSEQHDVSQAWANADNRLPSGWRVNEFRKNGMRWAYARSALAAQASTGQVRSSRAEYAGDPWTVVAAGPGGMMVTSRREPTPDDAARDLVEKVREHLRRVERS